MVREITARTKNNDISVSLFFNSIAEARRFNPELTDFRYKEA